MAIFLCSALCVGAQNNGELPSSSLSLPLPPHPEFSLENKKTVNEGVIHKSDTVKSMMNMGKYYAPHMSYGRNSYIPNEMHFPGEIEFLQNPYHHDYNIAGAMPLWDRGYLVGSGSLSAFPVMGSVQQGCVGLMQNVGSVDISVGLTGAKYQFGYGVGNNYGAFGNVNWHINDRLTLNVFGAYSHADFTRARHLPVGMLPYVGATSFGATVGYDVSSDFAIEAGAQRVYDPLSRKWHVIPVFTPSVKVWNSRVGVDLGGIIYGILQSLASDSHNYDSWKNNARPNASINDNTKAGRQVNNDWNRHIYHK